jgi:hypothetical protein
VKQQAVQDALQKHLGDRWPDRVAEIGGFLDQIDAPPKLRKQVSSDVGAILDLAALLQHYHDGLLGAVMFEEMRAGHVGPAAKLALSRQWSEQAAVLRDRDHPAHQEQIIRGLVLEWLASQPEWFLRGYAEEAA